MLSANINKHPEIAGVIFDILLTFNSHAKYRIQSRNHVLKSIAGSTCGKDEETLSVTYKAICRPVANYAPPIFTPQLCHSNWQKVHRPQNASLRIITGWHSMSNIDHLHKETNVVIEIKEHCAVQYALKCDHPNYELTRKPDPPRNTRKAAIVKYTGTA